MPMRHEARLNGLLQITMVESIGGGHCLIQARTLYPHALTRHRGSAAELDCRFALVRAECIEAWLQQAEEHASARIEAEVRQ